MVSDMKIMDGSRICIVGAGPAGCFAALQAMKLAKQRNIRVEITLLETRSNTPDDRLPPCKGCAGVLSTNLLDGLKELEIEITPELLYEEIQYYSLHLPDDTLILHKADPSRPLISVYRGISEAFQGTEKRVSFDSFLQNIVKQRGARLLYGERVVSCEPADTFTLITEKNSYEADFVVFAIGVNAKKKLLLPGGYRPPHTVRMSLAEVPRPKEWSRGSVAVFFDRPRHIFFGGFVPKDKFINIALIRRKGGGTRKTVQEFMDAGIGPIKDLFSLPLAMLCQCQPRIGISAAKNICADRWVAVGDAAVSRLYKDGIGSAFRTTAKAMETAFTHGVSKVALRTHYLPFCRHIAFDNLLGRMLFASAGMAFRRPILANAVVKAVLYEQERAIHQGRYYRIIWGLLTGDTSYRDLMFLALQPRTWGGILYHLWRNLFGRDKL